MSLPLNTVTRLNTAEILVKRSRFIGIARPIASEEEAQAFLASVKELYPQARHYCYAYILEPGDYRYSDDNEPDGTAGPPILNYLQKNNISYAVVAVVRYFGGILLGAGGLTHAYMDATATALAGEGIVAPAAWCRVVTMQLPYESYNILKNFAGRTPDIEILEILYYERVVLTLALTETQAEGLLTEITNLLHGPPEMKDLPRKFCVMPGHRI